MEIRNPDGRTHLSWFLGDLEIPAEAEEPAIAPEEIDPVSSPEEIAA